MTEKNSTRRKLLRSVGTAGVAGIGSMAVIGEVEGVIYPFPGAYDFVTSKEFGDFCTIGPESLTLLTWAASADIVPGDEIVLGGAAATSALGCGVRTAFVDEHGKPNQVGVSRKNNNKGKGQKGDKVVGPYNGNAIVL